MKSANSSISSQHARTEVKTIGFLSVDPAHWRTTAQQKACPLTNISTNDSALLSFLMCIFVVLYWLKIGSRRIKFRSCYCTPVRWNTGRKQNGLDPNIGSWAPPQMNFASFSNVILQLDKVLTIRWKHQLASVVFLG